jgi:hypothetical protein
MNLPPLTTEICITISASDPAAMTVRQLLTKEQIDALTEWYVTEGIDKIQYGDTWYTLVKREEPSS